MEKVYRFDVVYERAPEGGFVAFVPSLPGCYTQGKTLEETQDRAKEAITVYLESLVAAGEPMPTSTDGLHGAIEVKGPKVAD